MKNLTLALLAFLLAGPAHAFVRDFVDDGSDQTKKAGPLAAKDEYNRYKQAHGTIDDYHGGLRELYKKLTDHVVVPGFISAAPISPIGRVVGPDVLDTSFRIGDTVFLRWVGPQPKVGTEYGIYTPAVVLQNMDDPTDFAVKLAPRDESEMIPKDHRLAGYFYEGSGRVRVSRIREGLVEAVIVNLGGQIKIGDELMPTLPARDDLKPTYGNIQLSAAIVSGSPADRISTTRNSFIYINRGSRDGVKVGQLFEAVERVKLDESAGAIGPEVSAGEAVIVYTTDSYSTAMITKQFDVIRIGSLLRTVNPSLPTLSKAPFANMVPESGKAKQSTLEEVPQMPAPSDELEKAPNLPDPMKKQPEKLTPLSELDALEKMQNFKNLSPEEKARLGKLSRQERLGEKGPGADDDNGGEAASQPLENSFSKGKKAAKKASKKKKQSNDEEELNMLMMQN